jgi:phosphoglycolate phosphatase-like HAD superfamily hydrolase
LGGRGHDVTWWARCGIDPGAPALSHSRLEGIPMKRLRRTSLSSLLPQYRRCVLCFVALSAVACTTKPTPADPLPSWNDGPAKKAILEFVAAVTDRTDKDYVAPAERIAVFDHDGTLWVEYPMYTQILFAFDRVKELAPRHPEWKTTQPFKALLEGDMKTVGASGMKGLMEIVVATHSGMTAAEFEKTVAYWLATHKQSKFKRLYTECIYQPQLELLAYLRAKGFKTFIVSGGGVAFMRPITEHAYGIPPEQVVGSSVVAEFRIKDGKPALMRMPKIDFINDKAGKPVGIYEHIGRRPILAFGNSDSDMQMIEYTMAGDGRRLGLFVHHTDEDREYAYDRKSHVGTLSSALDYAEANGWIIVSMKKDWNRIFAVQGE